MTKRIITPTELQFYNGRNGTPALIAFQGLVYDVSTSYHWQDGKHHVVHFAGADLTDDMDLAPHGADLLKRFPVVGILRNESG